MVIESFRSLKLDKGIAFDGAGVMSAGAQAEDTGADEAKILTIVD